MIPVSLPYEYLHYFDRHDRVRRMGFRPIGSHVRRATPNGRAIDQSSGRATLRVRPT